MSRGDRREDMFLNDVGRQDFLKTDCDRVLLNTARAKLLAPEDRWGGGWAILPSHRKHDPGKPALAAWLRTETTLTSKSPPPAAATFSISPQDPTLCLLFEALRKRRVTLLIFEVLIEIRLLHGVMPPASTREEPCYRGGGRCENPRRR